MDDPTQPPQPRLAVITGGAADPGKTIAATLARGGWSVFLQHAPNAPPPPQSLADIESAARQAGGEVRVLAAPADLTADQDRVGLVESVLEEFGRIDLLVCAGCSGLTMESPPAAVDLLEVTEPALADIFHREVLAAFLTMQQVASEMVRLAEAGIVENPKIIAVNPTVAPASGADHADLCLRYAALSAMVQLLANRLGRHGINVYEFRTALVLSGAAAPVHARYDKLIDQGLAPLRRWGHPADVARAVAAVAQDLLDFSTGQVLHIDGGLNCKT